MQPNVIEVQPADALESRKDNIQNEAKNNDQENEKANLARSVIYYFLNLTSLVLVCCCVWTPVITIKYLNSPQFEKKTVPKTLSYSMAVDVCITGVFVNCMPLVMVSLVGGWKRVWTDWLTMLLYIVSSALWICWILLCYFKILMGGNVDTWLNLPEYLFCAILAVVAAYRATRSKAKTFSLIGITFGIMITVLAYNFVIPQLFIASDNVVRFAIRVLLHPALTEAATVLARLSAQFLHINPVKSVNALSVFPLVALLYGRILITSMNTYEYTAIMAVTVAVFELFARMTWYYRWEKMRKVYSFIFKQSKVMDSVEQDNETVELTPATENMDLEASSGHLQAQGPQYVHKSRTMVRSESMWFTDDESGKQFSKEYRAHYVSLWKTHSLSSIPIAASVFVLYGADLGHPVTLEYMLISAVIQISVEIPFHILALLLERRTFGHHSIESFRVFRNYQWIATAVGVGLPFYYFWTNFIRLFQAS